MKKLLWPISLIIILSGASFLIFSAGEKSNNWRSFFSRQNATSTAQEIASLRLELEKLKNQPPQIIYQTILTPATSSPVQLKTQSDLAAAKNQITSLESQLREIQNQTPTPTLTDAELIKSWQAESKVAQIACASPLLGTWQFGSGALISADGKILTNQHVVTPTIGPLPDHCLVMFDKDYDAQRQGYLRQYRASLTGFFAGRDAALLKIQDVIYRDQAGQVQASAPDSAFSYFKISGAAPQIADPIYVLGFPESAGFYFSVTKGIISNFAADNYFGTDAQIDRGNSGGAALNAQGELVGLPTYKFAISGDYRGYILDIRSINLGL